jgi:hypothetical protein
MDGLLPPSMFGSSSSSAAKRSNIPEQLGSSARARPQTPPRNRSHQVKAPPTQDGDRGTVEIVWCGDPQAILAVSVDGCLEVFTFACACACVRVLLLSSLLLLFSKGFWQELVLDPKLAVA